MDTCFLDKDGQYFETLTPVETPKGCVRVPKRPDADHVWEKGRWVASDAPARERVEEELNWTLSAVDDALIELMGEILAEVRGTDAEAATKELRARLLQIKRAHLESAAGLAQSED